MEDKIIERGTQSLSFVEQLQNQIQLCREALSDITLPLTPKVEALEILLWAKLKDDMEYKETMKKINEWFKEKTKDKDGKEKILYQRERAKKQFKAIMIFIDKKGFMPLGDY